MDAVYVFPDPAIEVRQLYDALGPTGAKIIGTTLPDPRPGGWVMGIQSDAVQAIQTAWPELLAGRGGQSIPSPLGLADVDPAYLTPGKQRLVQKVLDDLAGWPHRHGCRAVSKFTAAMRRASRGRKIGYTLKHQFKEANYERDVFLRSDSFHAQHGGEDSRLAKDARREPAAL